MEEKKEFVQAVNAIAKYHEPTTGIPAALMTAQACHESGYGTSYMAVNDNNLFGFVGYTYDNYWQAIASYEYTLTHNSAYRHLQGKSLEEWVNGIGPAGYCNEPGYSDHLWNMINQWDLA